MIFQPLFSASTDENRVLHATLYPLVAFEMSGRLAESATIACQRSPNFDHGAHDAKMSENVHICASLTAAEDRVSSERAFCLCLSEAIPTCISGRSNPSSEGRK